MQKLNEPMQEVTDIRDAAMQMGDIYAKIFSAHRSIAEKLIKHVDIGIENCKDEDWIATNGETHMMQTEYMLRNWQCALKMMEKFQLASEASVKDTKLLFEEQSAVCKEIMKAMEYDIPKNLEFESKWFKFWK